MMPTLSRELCAPPGAPVFELGTRCLPWEQQAACVLEFARSREVDPECLLSHCRLTRGALISPQQLLALLAAVQLLLPASDTPFVLGQLSLPGQGGLASHALLQASTLGEALSLLCRYAGRLSPLLTPRLLRHGDEVLLLWTESCGVSAAQRAFVVDMHMSALKSLCQWQGGTALPWRFCFNRTRPRDLSQHAVFLGAELSFGCQFDAMRLPAELLSQAWPRAVVPNLAAAALAQQADPTASGRGLLAALYDWLLPRYREAPSLDQAAQAFGVSPATLKRRLAQHGSHYQAQLDQARSHVALYLMLLQGRSSEAVAGELGFNDRSNFRRSFKRWTGLTPGVAASG
ncbi:AraC family transcriptional regulator ligand-binding domain-containing protein [Roseateles sp. DB2]|uniref:AraC family transcriptional regulator n=1 Tax=Roseateles sp. DB2 TaxID=3453717 RepID=UPI003EEFD540